MPEWPDVNYQKKYADATSLHKKITDLDFDGSKVLEATQKDFRNSLVKRKLTQTQQHGKYLFFKTDKDNWLVLHFGMTGRLEFAKDQNPPKHARFVMRFGDSGQLSFVCPRMFGRVYLTEGIKDFREKHSLGPDVLDLSREDFEELMNNKSGSVKGSLTDQHLMAGIGNIYADEILYHAKIHPKSKVNELTRKERKAIFKNISKVLKKAVESISNDFHFPTTYLLSHREEGAGCPNCEGKVKKIKVSGRSTYFCPSCQKEKS